MSGDDEAVLRARLQALAPADRIAILRQVLALFIDGSAVPVPEEQPAAPRRTHNSKAVILAAPEICQRLKISQRTLYRRLATDWAEGYWFFKIHDKWHIRESHLEELIGLMETGQIKM